MKRIFPLIVASIFLFGFFFVAENEVPSTNSNEEKAIKIARELLSRMTLEEKVGQMYQLSLENICKPRMGEGARIEIDSNKLRNAIINNNCGSILNTGNGANSLDSWQEIITAIQDVATKETRLKIPVLYGIDAIHGVNYTLGATLFPQAFTMAATRNKELVKRAAEITAYEMRASGIPWNFNPVLDMGREPLWPRFWETLGEDVYLASTLGKLYVEGIQGNNPGADDKGAVCLKHYMGYSAPKNGQDRTPAWISERMLREIFLPPFAEAVKAGALTVMTNSSEINGIPVHSDYFIVTEILKYELGFKGFVVSDWEDIKRLYTRDRVADSPKEAVRMAVMAGIDMSMVPDDFSFYDLLLELVNEGTVPISRIDDAVERILYVKYLLGLFDNPYPEKKLVEKFACEEFTETNIEAAGEAITLLKNENRTLPLSPKSKVLVTGPTANLLSVMNSGWTITWQGSNEALYPPEKYTVVEATQKKIGGNNVVYIEGCDFENDINIDKALKAAEDVDQVVMCLGEPPYCETPGNIKNLELNEIQLQFAARMYEKGKPVTIILIEGRPRVISKIVDGADAILMAYLPGMEGGLAIADILFGTLNPSGKLPFTYPKYVNGNTTYDHKPLEKFDTNNYDPQWSFGFGLSYTKFEYSDLALDKNSYEMNDIIKISVSVKNVGERAGKESVELYICDLYGSVSRPVKQLKGFEKILLEPGQSKIVNFELNKDDLSFIGRENKRIVEPGEFKVMVDRLETSFVLN